MRLHVSTKAHRRCWTASTYQEKDPRCQRDGAEDARQRFVAGQRQRMQHGGGEDGVANASWLW